MANFTPLEQKSNLIDKKYCSKISIYTLGIEITRNWLIGDVFVKSFCNYHLNDKLLNLVE